MMPLLHHKTIRLLTVALLSVMIFISTDEIKAQKTVTAGVDTLTKSILIHPVIEAGDGHIVSSEHTYKPKLRLGDQLARDFGIGKLSDKGFLKRFKNDGTANEDWYGWRQNVLAPINGKVTRVNHPDTTNKPGTMNREASPGLIFFEKDNGLTVIYAHVREIEVEKGDRVQIGEVVAKVGNNGNSRNPHVHVGAWKGDTPLQIQVDLYAEERYGN